MKRILLLLLVFVMLAPLPCLASPIGNAQVESLCDHTYIYKFEVVLSDHYESADDYNHKRFYADKYQCTKCGQTVFFVIPHYYETEAHSKRHADLGHVPGTLAHRARQWCSKLCGFDKEYTYRCSGSPCVYPY